MSTMSSKRIVFLTVSGVVVSIACYAIIVHSSKDSSFQAHPFARFADPEYSATTHWPHPSEIRLDTDGLLCMCWEIEAKEQWYPPCDPGSPDFDPHECCTQVCLSCKERDHPAFKPAYFHVYGVCYENCVNHVSGFSNLCDAFPGAF